MQAHKMKQIPKKTEADTQNGAKQKKTDAGTQNGAKAKENKRGHVK